MKKKEKKTLASHRLILRRGSNILVAFLANGGYSLAHYPNSAGGIFWEASCNASSEALSTSLSRPISLDSWSPLHPAWPLTAAASALVICETGLPEQHRLSRRLHISWYNKITFANVTTGLSLGKLATTWWQTHVFQNSNNWLKAWILSLATNKVGCHFWSDRLTLRKCLPNITQSE